EAMASRAVAASTAQEDVIIGARPWSLLFERGIYRFPGRAARPRRWGQPCAKRRRASNRRATKARNRACEPGRCCGQAPNKVVDQFVNWRTRGRDKRR